MKKITLEDVNNAILGTDIKILDSKTIINSNIDLRLEIKSLTYYGVYVLNYRNAESYIGMVHKRILKSRLLTYTREHQRKLIESIDIFVTNCYHAPLLENILINKFKPELNGHQDDVNDKFASQYLELCKKGDAIDSNYWKIYHKTYKEWMYRSQHDKNWSELGSEARINYERILKENSEIEKREIENLINELEHLSKKYERFNRDWEKWELKHGMIYNSYFGRVTAIGLIYGIIYVDDNVVYDDISEDAFISVIQIKLRKKYKSLINKAKHELEKQ